MIHDQGPNHSLGFGVNSRDLIKSPNEREGGNPEAGILARSLRDNPVMKFFAASTATMVGMHVAGRLVRGGGVRLASKLSQNGGPWATQKISDFRAVQRQLDEWQGVTRKFADPSDPTKLFVRDADGQLKGDTANELRGFLFSDAEQRTMMRQGLDATAAGWTWKHEMQQRMVRQARRLPYELPAAYMTQRAITDPLFGVNEERDPVNWWNPVDVIADFASQSARNIAFMIAPWEAGTGAVAHGYRRFMTYGDNMVSLNPRQQNVQTASLAMKTILARVGADATELMDKGIKLSSRTTGSFSMAIQEARNNKIGVVEYLHKSRHGYEGFKAANQWERLTREQRFHKTAEFLFFNQGTPTNKMIPDVWNALPGPFKGMGQGLTAARKEWTRSGKSHDAYAKMLRLGRARFNDVATYEEKLAVRHAMGAGQSPIEELAGRVDVLGKGGANSSSFSSGKFYNELVRDQYAKVLNRRLRSKGVSDDVATRFAQISSITPPSANPNVKIIPDISHRFHFGKGAILNHTDDEFYDELFGRLGMFDRTQQTALKDSLRAAVDETDSLFREQGFRQQLDDRIRNQWTHFEKRVLPKFGSRILQHVKEPYKNFDVITPHKKQFLQRRAALESGFPVADDLGRAVPDDAVQKHLSSIGFNPNNTDQLKAFLVTKGAVSKPWSRDGRNVFGLRALTISEGLRKGYFDTSEGTSREIQRLTASMALNDPVSSTIGLFKLKGVYETNNGGVIDFSILQRRAARFMNNFADDFQIPLLHTKPLQLFGWGVRQDVKDHAILQFLPSMARTPGVLGREADDDFYMWMRQGHRQSKGTVHAFNMGSNGPESRRLAGSYVPSGTDAFRMTSRHARLAIGEPGQARLVGDEPSRFDRLFSRRADQSGSFASFVNAFRKRDVDITNPSVMARFMSGETVTFKGQTFVLRNNRIVNTISGEELYGEKEVAEAFLSLGSGLRKNSLPSRVIQELESRHPGLFTYNFGNRVLNTVGSPNGAGEVSIPSLRTSAQVREAADHILSIDAQDMAVLDEEARASLRRAQESLIWRHLDNATGPSYWDRSVPRFLRSDTIHTRADELRADLLRYLPIRQGIMEGKDFSRVLPDLELQLQKMKSTGAISQADLTESRAALLSLQIHYQNFKNFQKDLPVLDNYQNIMASVLGTGGSATKTLLGAISSGQVGLKGGPLRNSVLGAMRNKFVPANPRFQGTEYNPYGSQVTLLPTFGTALARNPGSAIKNAIGLNSWSAPQSFTRASIPMSHLMDRLNRYFGAAGMAVDETQFKGPLGFYTKGVVGKRVFPAVAGGAAIFTVDRTIGGLINPKDEYGERVYSPFFIGMGANALMQAQAGIQGIIPGGKTYTEAREELENGEVAVRAGRYWPLGSTPFMGGRIQYYRPSWYRRLKSGYMYTDQTYGSPLERAAFGYDFSPLRPFDPYRFEREHYDDRPYPVTGEYFSGPWGPLTSVLNMTLGKVLKPQFNMHKDAVAAGLSNYAPVGEGGAYLPGDAGAQNRQATLMSAIPRNTASRMTSDVTAMLNSDTSAMANMPMANAGANVRGVLAGVNERYASGMRNMTVTSPYGVPTGGIAPRIIGGAPPGDTSQLGYQARKLGYEAQELFGIYGFMFGSLRDKLGYGNADLTSTRPVLASSSAAYGTSRAFWDLNLGGLGDAPLPIEGSFANFEFSEVMRRFIPRERSGTQFINPIPNQLGLMHPWLPGANYFTNFKLGDPYTAVQEGEMRLPGHGYERLNRLHSDSFGKYGIVDQHKILGDVAPWSEEYRKIDRMVDEYATTGAQRERIATTRYQVQQKGIKNHFTPYKYKYSTPSELGITKMQYLAGRAAESFSHKNTYFHTKFLNRRTAVEDWEREHVYGSTFPQWSAPVEDFLKPMIYNASQRNPIVAALALGTVGRFFFSKPTGKAVGSVIGGVTGFTAASVGDISETITGQRFMPARRRKEIALEEYTDILSYTKARIGLEQARAVGDQSAASRYLRMAQSTMYGADIYTGDIEQLAMAIPKRKRDHFRTLINAPEQERKQILSTAGRLERRIYEAVWGMPIEERPDLTDYFTNHELPTPEWEGWHPNTNMDHVKIKIGQSLGLDMSQMGYYPQQQREANLVNPSYPDFRRHQSKSNVEAQLRQLLARSGVSGDVIPVQTPYPGQRLQIDIGVI